MDGSRLRIYLAGNIALERGNTLVPESRFPGSQGRLAFAFLVAERSSAVALTRIAEVLWDGGAPAAWETALRSIVSKLRGVIAEADADATIRHAFGCYQLRLPPDTWVDLEAAAAAAHESEAALRAGDLTVANGAALVANAIARRPFLEGVARAWADQQRARLREIQIRALSCRAEAAIANGNLSGAVGDAERIIELEPFREHAYVLLMRAHIDAGNHAEALATYERLRVTLAEELGASPSPVSEAAFDEVLRAT
jgi:SARP family transcriptional regulator, regulator of embCAB operon